MKFKIGDIVKYVDKGKFGHFYGLEARVEGTDQHSYYGLVMILSIPEDPPSCQRLYTPASCLELVKPATEESDLGEW